MEPRLAISRQHCDRRAGSRPRRRVLWTAVLIAALWTVPDARSQAACDALTLDRAGSAFRTGWFVHTFDLLKPCLPDGFPSRAEQTSAYRLMALSYIATDSLQLARTWVKRLVEFDPGYRADPHVDPPVFVDYVEDFRPRWYSWLWKGGAWYRWAGRGLIVAGIVALPLVLRGTPESDLPGPPIFPSN